MFWVCTIISINKLEIYHFKEFKEFAIEKNVDYEDLHFLNKLLKIVHFSVNKNFRSYEGSFLISIYKFGLSVWLFVSNKRQNGWTDRAQIFCENPRIIFVLFYDVHKENMFTINLEDGREAPYKAS